MSELSLGTILLQDYIDAVRLTDRLSEADLRPVLMGLFGEVGSIMAPAKKRHREGEAFTRYQSNVEEEFGDALWYFTALCRRLSISLLEIISRTTHSNQFYSAVAAGDTPNSGIVHIYLPVKLQEIDDALIELGKSAANLLGLKEDTTDAYTLLESFSRSYIHALHAAKISFSRVVHQNINKTQGRFLSPDRSKLPLFDSKFGVDEQLPKNFEISIKQRSDGRSCLQWHDVFIGDPLTDNIRDPDGYRFHDVFHFAHAAILHWSPTFRALIKQKRKSNPIIDEAQDGGRAIVVEEGLTAWVFSRAKELDLFENQTTISFDILKTIKEFVKGYEVEECPLKLWEDAILQGYKVFRELKKHSGGIVIGDRDSRTIMFQPFSSLVE